MKITEIMPKFSGTVFIDMDGVVADCIKGMADHSGKTVDAIKAEGWDGPVWCDIMETSDVEKFFATLPWETNGRKLLNWLIGQKLTLSFLTRPVSEPFDTAACMRGKVEWWLTHKLTDIPIIFEFDKEKYAVLKDGTPNILIDDHGENIRKWTEAGGFGVKYKNGEIDSAIDQLSDYLNR